MTGLFAFTMMVNPVRMTEFLFDENRVICMWPAMSNRHARVLVMQMLQILNLTPEKTL